MHMVYNYDNFLDFCNSNNVKVKEKKMKAFDGLYYEGRILIDKDLNEREKLCIGAEEYGHHLTCTGNILDQRISENKKEELLGRAYAYKMLADFDDIIQAYDKGCRSLEDLADYLNVTVKFLYDMFNYSKNKYGEYKDVNGRRIYFIPYIYVA